MGLFVLFTLVHVAMVFYAGPVNELRSMITGRFRVRYRVDEVASSVAPPVTISPALGQEVRDD